MPLIMAGLQVLFTSGMRRYFILLAFLYELKPYTRMRVELKIVEMIITMTIPEDAILSVSSFMDDFIQM